MLSVTQFCGFLAAWVGVQAYVLWSTNAKWDSKDGIILMNMRIREYLLTFKIEAGSNIFEVQNLKK